MLYKKYRKMRTAYSDDSAMFNATDHEVIVDPETLMPIRNAAPGEPGAVHKMFPKWEICKKETKRWSSGLMEGQIKRCEPRNLGCLTVM